MFGLGFTEILFILFLALILIGPKQLPEVARTLGRFLHDLKRTTNVLTEEMKQSIDKESIQKTLTSGPTPKLQVDTGHEAGHQPEPEPELDPEKKTDIAHDPVAKNHGDSHG